MESQYGPQTNRRSKKKDDLMKKLFGSDSENENKSKNKNSSEKTNRAIQQLHAELRDLSDSENDDVLEITIEKDALVTPEKVSHSHSLTHSQTHKSPTSTVKHILLNTIESKNLLSPLPGTPTHNTQRQPNISINNNIGSKVLVAQPHTHNG